MFLMFDIFKSPMFAQASRYLLNIPKKIGQPLHIYMVNKRWFLLIVVEVKIIRLGVMKPWKI